MSELFENSDIMLILIAVGIDCKQEQMIFDMNVST